ncbi:T9SS type A sorting domain-containing protein [Flavobacterium hauense]
MKKLYLLLTFMFFAVQHIAAQTTEETFEGATHLQSSFTSGSATFNMSGPYGFNVFDSPSTGLGYNASSNFIQVNDPANQPVLGQTGVITIASGFFKLNSLWIYLTGVAEQYPNVSFNGAAGSVTFVGKLGGVEQFSVIKTYPSSNIGYGLPGNGFNSVDFTAQSGLSIDRLEIQLSGNYDYFAIDNFKWTANTTPTIGTTGTLSAFSSCAGSVSASQNFSATGTNLTAGISVAGPTGYEFSATSGGTYTTTLSLPSTGGTVYARLSASATGNPGGNITLTSTGATSQTIAVSGTVTAIPNVTVNPTAKTVCAGSNTTFSVTATNSPNYQWQVSTGSGFSDLTNTAPYSGVTTSTLTITGVTATMNNYQYRAKLINGSCTDNSNSAALTIPTALGSSISTQNNVTTYGGNNGSATVAATGGTTPYFYSWFPSGGTAAGASGLTAGTYTVTITDSTPNGLGGCTKTQTVTIAQPAGVSASVTSLSAFSTCSGTASTAQSFTVSGGSGLTANVIVTAPTGYEVSLLPGSGYGGTVTITPSVGNITTTTIHARLASTATGTPVGNITVSSTGVTTKNVAVTGTVNAITFTTHPSDSSVCPGGDTTFTGAASNATGYQWKVSIAGGPFNNVTNTAPYSGATTATLTITGAIAGMNGYQYRLDATGSCPTASSNVTTLTVGGTPAVTGNPANRTICTGFNTTISVAATGASIYQWQVSIDGGNNYNDIANGAPYSGVTTPTLTVTGATSAITGYRYRCTVGNGCTSTNSSGGILSVITIIIGQSQTNVTTYGGSNGTATATPSGGISPYTYSWSPSGGSAATATNLPAGTYTVTVKDDINCQTTSANYVITQPAGVATSVSTLTAFATCSGTASANKTFTVNGGGLTADLVVTAPTGYEVSLTSGSGYGGSVSLTQTGGNVATRTIYVRMAATASGTMNGNVTVTSTGVTTKNVTVTGLASNLSASSYIVSNVSCFGGNNGSIDLTPSGGQIPYTYNWGGASTQDRTSIVSGTYSVTITDNNSCTYTINNIVVGQPAAALSAAAGGGKTDVSCFGGNNGTATVAPTGGTTTYTYLWDTSPQQTTATAVGLTAGTYTVTVTDANGCQATRTFTINQPAAALNVNTGGGKTDVSCNGGANGTATVAPTGGTTTYSYLWDTTPTQATATATGLSQGTYTVTVTDANGCQRTRSFTINQPSTLVATTGTINNASCNGGANGSAQVIASGGTPAYTYSWNTTPVQTTATANGLSAGTYTVTVKDAKNCETTQDFTISEPASLLVATAASQTDVSCNGGVNGMATVSATGGTGAYTYSWTPSGGTAATASGLGAGTYTVTVKDANNCTDTQSFTILQPANAVTASAVAQTNIACRGNATGSATVSASGGTGAYTYSWAPTGGTLATASNLTAGTYTVTVTDANGCTDTETFTLTQPAAALATTAGTINNVSCNTGANGSAQVIVSGGTTPYTYNWDGTPIGDGTATISGLSAGTYNVTVTDGNGCQATRAFTVTQPAPLVASFGSQNNVSCNGGTNGMATVAVTGGTGTYTYLWNPTGGTAASASGLPAGNYTVIVKDANLCQTTQSFTILQPAVLTSTISKTDVLCNGGATGTASVIASGGTLAYTYLWSPSGGTAATASGLAVGNYSCLITDNNGCFITKNITINQPSILGATTSQTSANCVSGGTASVSPFGGVSGYTYLWAPGGATTQSVSGLAAGTHTCLITDANGCTVTKTIIITTTNTLVASTFQNDLLCNGVNTGTAGVIPAGAPGPYTYVWSPSGGSADTASNLAAGNYSVVITASNGCSITKNFTITQPSALVATAGTVSNVSCNTGNNGMASVNVTGGTGAYTYLWAPSGGTAATANGLAAGTYTVTVKDANLCQTTQSFTITQPNALVASVGSQTNVSCNGGTNGSATVSVTGGTGTYTYLWMPSGGTGVTASGLAAGTYTVTVKDANLCQTSQSFTITEPAALTATTSQTNVLCNGGSTGTASVTTSGGTAAYTYLWAPTGGTAAAATGLAAGTYTCTITDVKGCFIIKTFTLTQPSSLVASAGTQNNLSCNGGANGSATVNVTGGTTPYTYDWNGTPIGDNTATISGLMAGTYTATVTDAKGCTTNQIFTITQPSALDATTSQVNVSCFGASNGSASVVVTGGTGAYTYLWAPSGGTAATANGLAVGTYTVTIKDANLCQITKSVTITSTQALTVIPTQTNVSCNGNSNGTASVAVTGGSGTYTYSWAPSGATTSSVTGLAPGTYIVTITDSNGCTKTQSFTITQPPVLVVNGSTTNITCNGGANGSATATATGGTPGYTYSWAPSGGTAATATGLSVGTYICTVTDANGCTQTRNFTILQQNPIVVTTSQTDVLCHGATTGSATVNVSGGVPGYSYLWAPSGGTAATASGLGEGTYTCTITDGAGCFVIRTFTITAPTAITVSMSQTNVTCSGNNDGTINIEATGGGVGPYTYTWSPAVATGTAASNLAAGNYRVTVSDANGCTVIRNFSITQPAPLSVSIVKTDVSCFGNNDGTALAQITGGTTPYTYSWVSSGGGTPNPTNLTAGTYTVTITDDNGCTLTNTITINQPLQAIVTNHPQDVSINPGGTATYTVAAVNANAYQWQFSDNGTNWTDVTDGGQNPAYSGATTETLTITNVPASYNGYLYRVATINGTNCIVYSNATSLNVNNELEAVDDDFSSNAILAGTGGIAGDVTDNDLFNNMSVNDSDITISITDNDGMFNAFIDDNGNLIVPPTATVGTYIVTYKICENADPSNCSTAEAIVEVTSTSGANDFRNLQLSVYPNPATTSVFIKIPDFTDHKNLKLSVHDLNGRLVKEEHLTTELQKVEVTGLESGVYIFIIKSDTAQATRRIVVDKKF